MCTLTYIPGKSGNIITSNRDEHPSRSANSLCEEQTGGRTIWYPRDAKAHGSWISADNQGRVVCLLNGGLEAHEHNPPYRMSRGRLVLEFMRAGDAEEFIESFSLGGMEPFTLLWFPRDQLIREWIWTGEQALIRTHSREKAVLWTAAQLYTKEDTRLKRSAFEHFLENHPAPNRDAVLRHHRSAQLLGQSSSRFEEIQSDSQDHLPGTISITQFRLRPEGIDIRYEDLLKEKITEQELVWNPTGD